MQNKRGFQHTESLFCLYLTTSMKNLVSILDSIYGQMSDAVFVYTHTDQVVYQNEQSTQAGFDEREITHYFSKTLKSLGPSESITDTITLDQIDHQVIISSLELINNKLKVLIVSHQSRRLNLKLTHQVKQILLNTSVSDQSFYQHIGELIQKELVLNNLYITIHDVKQKELIIKYLSNNSQEHDLDSKKQQYNSLAKRIISNKDRGALYSKEEINKYEEHTLEFAQYLFIPIKSKNVVIGGIGVFNDDQSDELSNHQKTLQAIAEYLGLFYGHQHLEETLLQQTSRLNAIFESSSDLIWSVDRSMEVVSFNQNYFRAIFYKYQGGIVTEHFKNGADITSPFDEFWEAKYQKVFTGNSLNFEIELKHPKNEPVWKEIFLMPIFKANGSIEEISGIAKDISDKKKTVTALHQEEKKFKQIFDSFQDLYVRVDLNGNIDMISPSVVHMIGYSTNEVLGQNVSDYYLYNLRTKRFFKKILQARTLRNIEIKLIGKQGEIIPCICNLRLILDEKQKPIAIEGICRDITEIKDTNEALLKAKESLEVSLKTKEQFLANMSHEIRTPMNGIIGLLDMMLDTRLSKTQEKYLSTIQESSKLLLNLLNDILDLSKISAGKLKVNYQTFSIGELLKDIKTLFASEIEQRKIDFSILIQKNVPEYINSDKLRILQILSNLISNAIKFTNANGSIIVRVFNSSPRIIKVNVIDTGIGIEAKDVKKLFKNFTQVNESYSKSYKGAGLGLAISKDLAKLLEGDIGVDSVYGRGSDFWFTFKIKPPDLSTAKHQKNEVENIKKSKYIDTKKVLVVDDNVTNRLVASEILRKSGLYADETDNAKTAIRLSHKNSYDIIFMDIQMPEMDGIQGMNHIKKKRPSQVVIAMTAFDEKNQSKKFIEMGFDGYLAKPITQKSLIQVISSATDLEADKNAKTSLTYDFEAIHELSNHVGIKTIKNTYHQFEKDLDIKINDCKIALENQSYDAIASHTHGIKGDASTLGLMKIASEASRIEKNIHKEHFSSLDEDLKTLYLMLAEVPIIIKEILNKLSHEYKNINS